MSKGSGDGYAGDLLSGEAYNVLSTDPAAFLIDVRTRAEWAYIGVPDLAAIDKTVLFLEWQSYPAMQIDPEFSARLTTMLEAAAAKPGAPLMFLCRSGARSRQAAMAMTRAGWSPCFNISDGFEGPLDPWRHRNVVGGWRACNLPWSQS